MGTDLSKFIRIVLDGARVADLSPDRSAALQAFAFLQDFAKDKVIYGITTGFGPLAQQRIAQEDTREAQYNLVRSHASGMGAPLPDAAVRATMLARGGAGWRVVARPQPRLRARYSLGATPIRRRNWREK